MADQSNSNDNLQMEGTVAEYFSVQGHVCSTRTADASKALDTTRNEAICLWLMRRPLSDAQTMEAFVKRMESIDDIVPAVSDMRSFGIDRDGMAFAVLPALSGQSIDAGNIEASEAERRFISCSRALDKLHKAQIVCGDLSTGSFWVDRAGSVTFIGVMGSPMGFSGITVPLEVQPFVAPEVLNGEEPTARSDVFSLGVLGYFLFTGKYPYTGSAFSLASIQSLKQALESSPIWGDEVLMSCLDPNPEYRPENATAILQRINDIRENSNKKDSKKKSDPISGATTSKSSGAQTFAANPIASGMTTAPAVRPKSAELPAELSKVRTALSRVVFFGLIVVVSVAGSLVGLKMMAKDDNANQAARSYPADAGNPEIEAALDVMEGDLATTDEKVQKIYALRDSDDPVAHHLLIETAMDAPDDRLRRIAEKSIIQRARRKGFLLSAEQIKQWLRTVKDPKNTAGYTAILKAVDPSLPQHERDALLREAYPSNQVLILRLAVAFTFDTGDLKDFQKILSQLIGDSLELENADEHSSLALIMAHKDLSLIFEDKIIQNRASLTDDDVRWILDILARRDDVNTRSVANLALERNLLPPVQSDLLKIIRDRSDIPADVVGAIVHVASGATTISDIQVFGRWYDVEIERILLSVLATSRDPGVLVEAFDTLAGKSPTIEPGASILNWVRVNHWKNRKDFARVIGVLGLGEKVPADDQLEALQAFDAYLDDTDTLYMLIDTKSALLARYLLENHDQKLDIGSKLNMLRHPNKGVRIAAIESITTNDVAALKIIVNAYEEEKDPEVKAKYKKFWVINERENK